MFLVAGLGNPSKEYDATRHNVGFEVVDALAEKLGWVGKGQFDGRAKRAFEGLVIEGMIQTSAGQVTAGSNEKVLLLKPQTYMNLSGRSIQSAMAFYKLTPEQLIVIVDELALPCGAIRLRKAGSDGGHNGLKSVQQMLSTINYPRLRVGIDLPPPGFAGRDYVLGRFTPQQRPLIDQAVNKSTGCIVTWIDKGIDAAMNQFNVKDSG
jgi:peptidyl-tRNA hydrolase, PTH1 family